MKELENVMSQLEKETKKKEQAENKIKQLRQKKSQLKRKADTKRKVEKGGVFEKFEKQITGVEENTDNDLIYKFRTDWINIVLPPAAMGAVVSLIGLELGGNTIREKTETIAAGGSTIFIQSVLNL